MQRKHLYELLAIVLYMSFMVGLWYAAKHSVQPLPSPSLTAPSRVN